MNYPAHVVLVCGPPCGGKSTWVTAKAGDTDLIIDFDDIARTLGSPVQWLHPEPYRSQAEAHIRSILNRLPGTAPGTAYVIRSAPAAQTRAIAARMIKAQETWIINPGRAECLRRAEQDDRPDGTTAQINAWYQRYQPRATDRHSQRHTNSRTWR